MPHAVRVRFEAVAAAAGVERVEDHDEAIVGAQSLAVAERWRDDQRGVAVVHAGADVEVVVVVEEVDLGGLGGRGAVAWADLVEVGDEAGGFPDLVV